MVEPKKFPIEVISDIPGANHSLEVPVTLDQLGQMCARRARRGVCSADPGDTTTRCVPSPVCFQTPSAYIDARTLPEKLRQTLFPGESS